MIWSYDSKHPQACEECGHLHIGPLRFLLPELLFCTSLMPSGLEKPKLFLAKQVFFVVVVVKNKQIHKKGKPIRDTRLSLEIC